MAPSVLLIGASGSLGRPLVDEFQKQRASFGRVAILSDPAKAHKFSEVQKNGDIEVISGSFLDFKCYQGFDVVLSLAGNATMRLQPAMIEAAIAGGVRHFYPSEFGTDITLPGVWQFRYFRDKVATRDHLAAKAKEVPGFRYTLLLCGAFSEWAAGEFSGVDVRKHTVEVYGYPDAEISVTAMNDVVRYTVSSILLPFPAEQSRREVRVRGDNLTWTQLIALLEEVQGVKYQVKFIDPEEAAKKQEEARQRGDEEGELMWAGRTVGPAGKVRVPLPIDNDKFGFKPEGLKETLQRLLKGN
ncbi:NAD(P)-binding protein [Mycena venus]|uniref:NAD(P)-binding protein n=1 Tax=Mycena venus TaxID=2733690 RepID=A0A8H7CIE7_9AGAR|nr:NAD(P)-binding protein [Mycena venus]